MNRKTVIALACGLLPFTAALANTELVIATVNNRQMIEMQKLTPVFEKANPDIKVKWVTLEETVLRQRVTTDIATKGGQFDIMTIGMYEAPIWAKKGWLKEIKPDANYDINDLLPGIRGGMSHEGKLYSAPFYGESSFTMYRSDLAQAAGVSIPEQPTYKDIENFASKVNNPEKGIFGICLRGKPSWGENMAYLTTLVNVHGGQWFDMQWKPQVNSKPWQDAITFYVDLMKKYGPPGASANGFNENLNLFAVGKCGMWIDATSAAGSLSDPKFSKVADKIAFAKAPIAVTEKGKGFSWSWGLSIPSSTKKEEAAQKFINWATSKDYVKLVADTDGWITVPTGNRKSTYTNPEFQKVSKFGAMELKAIEAVDVHDATLPKSPYQGVQFAGIPEFQAIGTAVGQEISAALAGKKSVADALKAGQFAADREMRKAGYYK
jgi:sorbitol/mannitol transport system substrate-binding protein